MKVCLGTALVRQEEEGQQVYKASFRTAKAVAQLGLFLETLSQKSKNKETQRETQWKFRAGETTDWVLVIPGPTWWRRAVVLWIVLWLRMCTMLGLIPAHMGEKVNKKDDKTYKKWLVYQVSYDSFSPLITDRSISACCYQLPASYTAPGGGDSKQVNQVCCVCVGEGGPQRSLFWT